MCLRYTQLAFTRGEIIHLITIDTIGNDSNNVLPGRQKSKAETKWEVGEAVEDGEGFFTGASQAAIAQHSRAVEISHKSRCLHIKCFAFIALFPIADSGADLPRGSMCLSADLRCLHSEVFGKKQKQWGAGGERSVFERGHPGYYLRAVVVTG